MFQIPMTKLHKQDSFAFSSILLNFVDHKNLLLQVSRQRGVMQKFRAHFSGVIFLGNIPPKSHLQTPPTKKVIESGRKWPQNVTALHLPPHVRVLHGIAKLHQFLHTLFHVFVNPGAFWSYAKVCKGALTVRTFFTTSKMGVVQKLWKSACKTVSTKNFFKVLKISILLFIRITKGWLCASIAF